MDIILSLRWFPLVMKEDAIVLNYYSIVIHGNLINKIILAEIEVHLISLSFRHMMTFLRAWKCLDSTCSLSR